jgi:hypothetical protein
VRLGNINIFISYTCLNVYASTIISSTRLVFQILKSVLSQWPQWWDISLRNLNTFEHIMQVKCAPPYETLARIILFYHLLYTTTMYICILNIICFNHIPLSNRCKLGLISALFNCQTHFKVCSVRIINIT